MTNPLELFVSLPLCSLLAERGLTRDTWAYYRQYADAGGISKTYLVAPGLDHAGVYQALDLPGGVYAEDYYDTPAYTLMDMLKLIPGPALDWQDGRNITVTAVGIFQLAPIAGVLSPPDAAAKMVLQVIEQPYWTIADMNKVLLTSK